MLLNSPLLRRLSAGVMAVATLATPVSALAHAEAMSDGAPCASMTMPGHTAPGHHTPGQLPPCCSAAFATLGIGGLPAAPNAPVIVSVETAARAPLFVALDRLASTPQLLPFAQGPPRRSA